MFGPYLVWAVRVSTVFRGSLIHAATPSMHADISCDTQTRISYCSLQITPQNVKHVLMDCKRGVVSTPTWLTGCNIIHVHVSLRLYMTQLSLPV